MQKKVVVFFLQANVGGAERVTVTIGKMLDKSIYDVKFCVTSKKKSAVQDITEFIPSEYQIIRIVEKNSIGLTFKLFKIINKYKPSVVFSSVTYLNTKLLAWAWYFRKTKFVVRNNNYLYTLNNSQKKNLKYTYYFADTVVAQTYEMKDELVKELDIDASKIFVLPNPIDIDTIDKKKNEPSPYGAYSEDCIKFVASGRFNLVKGFDILIQSFAIVHKQMPSSRLFILGEYRTKGQNHYQMLRSLACELGISDYIHFEGFQTNPYKYVKYADCFVLSSRNEGLPNVLIEALYLGTPVASTTCIPVIERIVEVGKTGYLANSENVEMLASAMINASNLGRVISSYTAADNEAFINLFN